MDPELGKLVESGGAMRGTALSLRLALIFAIALTLGMIGAQVLGYPRLVSLSGAKGLISEALFLLVCYGIGMAWPEGVGTELLRPQFASLIGAGAGFVQVTHLLVERFCTISGSWNGIVTLGFMLATFLMWGYSGYRGRGCGLSLRAACLAAIWCAMVTMTIGVFAGTLLEYYIARIPTSEIEAWVEYTRSGWGDVTAFSIANTIDEASTHLLIGPIVGFVFGAFGYSLPQPGGRHERRSGK
jgi:hypothetical protein